MKTGWKKLTSLLLTGLMLVSLCPGGVSAQAAAGTEGEQPTAIMAPLNPAFVTYVNDLAAGKISGASADGFSPGHIPEPLARYQPAETESITTAASLPAAYDLRTTGRVTAIRDQNPYGSCWSFASLASLESYLKEAETADLSENNLMRNHGFDWGPNDGGNAGMAAAYLTRWSGPVSESDDPYGTVKKTGLAAAYHVQDVDYLPASATAIKEAIIAGGAVDSSIHSASMDNDYYYNSATAAYYYDGFASVDHDIAIVGWDDNYDASNFSKTPPGNGAWIIKNSWGTDDGDNGYFYLSYYDRYAANEATAFHNAEATDNYNRNYQYDPLGKTSAIGYDSTTAWGANIFTAVASENLAAVSTFIFSPNTSLQIEIYTNVSNGQPSSGNLAATKTVTEPLAGYHTIDLDEAVPLSAGSRFAVVIRYTTPGYAYPVPLETRQLGYSSAATANPGESFVSSDSDYWSDISQNGSTNVCIKAFTQSQAPAVLKSIAITSPASKLSYQIGDALDLSGLVVTGTYSDGTTKTETIAAANVSGFNSTAAAASQLLTITVAGKTTSYVVAIVASGQPGQGKFIGFLGQDADGYYYVYNQVDFNNAYLAYQVNPGMAAANMYWHYLNNQCHIVALEDQTRGYMDYQAAATASLIAQINEQPFDINAYFGSGAAKLYGETVADVIIVDQSGNEIY